MLLRTINQHQNQQNALSSLRRVHCPTERCQDRGVQRGKRNVSLRSAAETARYRQSQVSTARSHSTRDPPCGESIRCTVVRLEPDAITARSHCQQPSHGCPRSAEIDKPLRLLSPRSLVPLTVCVRVSFSLFPLLPPSLTPSLSRIYSYPERSTEATNRVNAHERPTSGERLRLRWLHGDQGPECAVLPPPGGRRPTLRAG